VSKSKTGIQRIAAERKRQIEAEGWTPDHDDDHEDGELARAAICYAAPLPVYIRARGSGRASFIDPWPAWWSAKWDKRPRDADGDLAAPTPGQRIRMLEKAGALIAAEIDRLMRASPSGEGAAKGEG
jgi:hypothetical protein